MINHFRQGDPLTDRAFRERLNRLVDTHNILENMTGDGLVLVNHTRTGVVIGLSRKQVPAAGRVPLGGIILWSGAVADIPDYWALCDGGEYCVRHGIKDHGCDSGTVTTVDLSGRFVMGIDEDGRTDEDAPGDTGGYRWHGITENNHPDHLDHVHWKGTPNNYQQSGTDSPIYYGAYTGVQTNPPSGEGGLVQRHGGIVNAWTGGEDPEVHSYNDTDNRPRYYALAFIQRIR